MGPPKERKRAKAKRTDGNAQGNVAVQNGRANRSAIVAGEPMHHGVLPLFRTFPEDDACHDWSDENGEDERTDQRKGHRPGHRPEQAAFD